MVRIDLPVGKSIVRFKKSRRPAADRPSRSALVTLGESRVKTEPGSAPVHGAKTPVFHTTIDQRQRATDKIPAKMSRI
jgi:hypothetical protein